MISWIHRYNIWFTHLLTHTHKYTYVIIYIYIVFVNGGCSLKDRLWERTLWHYQDTVMNNLCSTSCKWFLPVVHIKYPHSMVAAMRFDPLHQAWWLWQSEGCSIAQAVPGSCQRRCRCRRQVLAPWCCIPGASGLCFAFFLWRIMMDYV